MTRAERYLLLLLARIARRALQESRDPLDRANAGELGAALDAVGRERSSRRWWRFAWRTPA